MGLPLMNLFTIPMNVQVLDQMQVLRAGESGQVLFQDTAIRRAAKLGQNIALALSLPPSSRNGWATSRVLPCLPLRLDGGGQRARRSNAPSAASREHQVVRRELEVTFSPEEQPSPG